MMTFLNPLDALIPKIPFSILFAEYRVRATAGAWGSVSVGLWGASIEPFLGVGGGLARGLYQIPPPPVDSPPTPAVVYITGAGLCKVREYFDTHRPTLSSLLVGMLVPAWVLCIQPRALGPRRRRSVHR